jgi:meso-butanediol dehydrogenase / (S,S)-butanediol dehydrogenase / diacetyl reductase
MNIFTLAPGRKALITGGASGFGFAIAERLAQSGALVAIADVDETKLASAAAKLAGLALPVSMNVVERASVARGVKHVVDRFGGLDTLVTSAGIFQFGDFATITEAEWDRTVDINLKGTFLVCQAALPYLRDSGRGRVVTVSSSSGKRGDDFASHYSASKFGVIGLTQSLAVESGGFGMTVNSVCPGTVPGTAMGQGSLRQKIAMRGLEGDELLDIDARSLPLRRLGTPGDVADAILFLITENASWITGQALSVDGGALLAGLSHRR